MADPGTSSSSAVFGSSITRAEVGSITFLTSLSGAPRDAWDVSQAKDGSVLAWASKNSSGYYDLYIGAEGGMTAPTNCCRLFRWYSNMTSIKFNGAFHTSGVTNMSYMFNACGSLTSVDVGSFDTSKVTTMEYMFSACSSLPAVDVSGFNTANVTTMYAMFYGCKNLSSLDVSGFNTANVTNMREMFRACKVTTLDLSGWNISNVTTMDRMFADCTSLATLNLNGWDISNVAKTDSMFDGVPESAIKW